MQHFLVMPMTDPRGGNFELLTPVLADLKTFFTGAFLGVSGPAAPGDAFLRLIPIPAGLATGEQFKLLYEQAAARSQPDDALHLSFIDRVSFAIRGGFRAEFFADLRALTADELPLMFTRSERAWETHPRNYREIESLATQLGRWVLGKTIDLAWCHLVMRAGQLREILPEVQNEDMSMLAEIALAAQAQLRTRPVDWLAWEDPLLLRRDAGELKREREASREETRKRLAYTLPALQLLIERGMLAISRLQTEERDKPPPVVEEG